MAKPFSIQSPEDIAKEYGGNKQKIAQAMQLGVVDSTAGVLAGMFIDRMRSAQTQEMVSPPTVAQQVMGGAPASPTPPPASPGGLGAMPQGAPPMAPPPGMGAMPPPDMGAPPMPEGPPMGMAEGGIVGLDIPETMFDESSNGGFDEGYAGGGLVAFADGGPIDAERLRRALLAQESRGDYGAVNEGSGAMGGYQFMPATARALAKRIGLPYRPELMTGAGGRTAEGKQYQERLMDAQMKDILRFSGDDVARAGAYHFAGPNEKGWKGKTRQYEKDILRRYSGADSAGEAPERASASEDRRSSDNSMDYFRKLQEQFGPSAEEKEVDAARMARAKEMASDEYYEKQRKEDMWSTLAQIGFNMASSKSPFLLQAIGEAAAAALPEARADKKERKALKDRALDVMAEMNGQKRKDNLQLYGIAVDAAQADIRAAQADKEFGLKERELEQRGDLAREQNTSAERIASMRPESLDFRESFAKSIFEDYKRRNAQGNLIVNGKRLPPNSVSDAELRVMAMQEVVNRMPKTQQGGAGTVDADFNGIPDTKQGAGAAADPLNIRG